MNEDTQLRIEAMRLTVAALESCAVEMEEIVKMATEVYEFLTGATK